MDTDLDSTRVTRALDGASGRSVIQESDCNENRMRDKEINK